MTSEPNPRLVKLDARPEGHLIGIRKMKKRITADIVGDYFANAKGDLFLRAYHHEANIILWYQIIE